MRLNQFVPAIGLVAIFFSSTVCWADRDTAPFFRHQFQTDALMLLGAMPNASYEYRINRTHAAVVRGGWQVPMLGAAGWVSGASYRHYYRPHGFWGIFTVIGKQSSRLPSPERGDTTTYTMNISYLTIGPNWGRTWIIGGMIPFTLCLGAGYPVHNEFTWKNGLEYPTLPKLVENLTRLSVCLDAGLSIGIGF